MLCPVSSCVPQGSSVRLRGWVKSARVQKHFVFLNLSDGSTLDGVQVVYDSGAASLRNASSVSALRTGCSIEVLGTVARPAADKPFEVLASQVTLIGGCDEVSHH